MNNQIHVLEIFYLRCYPHRNSPPSSPTQKSTSFVTHTEIHLLRHPHRNSLFCCPHRNPPLLQPTQDLTFFVTHTKFNSFAAHTRSPFFCSQHKISPPALDAASAAAPRQGSLLQRYVKQEQGPLLQHPWLLHCPLLLLLL